MAIPFYEAAKSLTAEQIEEWIETASAKAMQLHSQALEPLYSTQREQALFEMFVLLQEALEKLHVVSAALRGESKDTGTCSTALLVRSVLTRERSKPLPRPFPPGQDQAGPATKAAVLNAVNKA